MNRDLLFTYAKWHPPGPYLEHAPGYWRWEDGWPIERIKEQRLYPQDNHTLSEKLQATAVHQLSTRHRSASRPADR